MAVNETRSMNADLQQGVTDGKDKSLAPDRGGEVDYTAIGGRAQELPYHYGLGGNNSPVSVDR